MSFKLHILYAGMFALFSTIGASAQTSEARIEQVGGANVAEVDQIASAAFLVQTGVGNEAYMEF